MKIVFASSEAAPFVKTGGLGDVAQALPKALSEYKGNEVLVFLPYYLCIKNNRFFNIEKEGEFNVQLSWRSLYVGLWRLKSRKRKLRIYFIDNEQYFNREKIYGYLDDGERFAFFSKAILESLTYLGERPDVIHCNDWQTALLPVLLHSFYSDTLGQAKTMFTIHNIEYQGWANPSFLSDVLGLGCGYEDIFSYNGSVNFMKGAILCSNCVTTVSKTYANEIRHPYFAHGLSSVINEHSFKLYGIINGIDMAENAPSSDPHLPQNYSADNFSEKKPICKSHLQKTCGLPVKSDVALIGIVSRLVEHKGLELICEAIDEIMRRNVQLVILGTGDERYEAMLKKAADRYTDKISVNLCFSQTMAPKVYAGCDMFLMPSKSEPCGLSQLFSMHYGAVPIVHETGGLRDTVIPFDCTTEQGLGFTFQSFTKEDMLDALSRALDVYQNKKETWEKAVYNCMSADFSWDIPAKKYMELYEKLIKNA